MVQLYELLKQSTYQIINPKLSVMNIKWNKLVLSQPWEKSSIFNIEIIKNNCYCGWAAGRLKKSFVPLDRQTMEEGENHCKVASMYTWCELLQTIQTTECYSFVQYSVGYGMQFFPTNAILVIPTLIWIYVENTPPFHYWAVVHNLNLPQNP